MASAHFVDFGWILQIGWLHITFKLIYPTWTHNAQVNCTNLPVGSMLMEDSLTLNSLKWLNFLSFFPSRSDPELDTRRDLYLAIWTAWGPIKLSVFIDTYSPFALRFKSYLADSVYVPQILFFNLKFTFHLIFVINQFFFIVGNTWILPLSRR